MGYEGVAVVAAAPRLVVEPASHLCARVAAVVACGTGGSFNGSVVGGDRDRRRAVRPAVGEVISCPDRIGSTTGLIAEGVVAEGEEAMCDRHARDLVSLLPASANS